MQLKMDATALTAFLAREFGQVAGEFAVDFMRKPAAGRDLLGAARVLKLGRSLAVGDVMIFSEGQADPVARASLTYAIPPKS